MSSIPGIGSGAQSLLQVSPHPHGHRHGTHVQTDSNGDSSTDLAAPVPAGTQRSLFGSLLSSLQQVLGLQAPADAAGSQATANKVNLRA